MPDKFLWKYWRKILGQDTSKLRIEEKKKKKMYLH